MASIGAEKIQERGRYLEWLESDGLGGFAMGTVVGIRTRRYHGLLINATQPPAGRMVLVNGVNVSLENEHGTVRLTPQEYLPGNEGEVLGEWLESFSWNPWPCWTYQVSASLRIIQELFIPHGIPAIVLSWRFEGIIPAQTKLRIRPFLTGRDFHALHHENPAFSFGVESLPEGCRWGSYEGVPAVTAKTNGRYVQEPFWYRNFFYAEEEARGLDDVEDAGSPGYFEHSNLDQPCILILSTTEVLPPGEKVPEGYVRFMREERERREKLGSHLDRAADAYLVQRGSGKTIIAGYPWFGDWGRDTFISLRGICLATGRFADARAILLEWAGAVSEGMLPNRFPDDGQAPEYNSVDASLWYVIACHDYLEQAKGTEHQPTEEERAHLEQAIGKILRGYAQGTRFGIKMDKDGLLSCGEKGVQLTWMDAKVGEWVVTPRMGKPVEIQALWLNALWIGAKQEGQWQGCFEQGLRSFRQRFWNESRGCLFDVIDCDHVPGSVDDRIRPNQIFAVGGLPFSLLEGEQAKAVVRLVEELLWTPAGLRSLAPGEKDYRDRYEGGVLARDGSYHQGTVWPWLAGAFIEGWIRIQGSTLEVKDQALYRFFEPLSGGLHLAGLGHLYEIADAEAPHFPKGCPFQAWSVGELLRVRKMLRS